MKAQLCWEENVRYLPIIYVHLLIHSSFRQGVERR